MQHWLLRIVTQYIVFQNSKEVSMIYLGDKRIGKVYLGGKKLKKIYLGDKLIWEGTTRNQTEPEGGLITK